MSQVTPSILTSGLNLFDLAGPTTGTNQQLTNSGNNLYWTGAIQTSNYWVAQSGNPAQFGTVTLDFLNNPGVQTLTVTGNTAFTGVNYLPGHAITTRIVAFTGVNLSFASGWSFVGAAAPTAISSGNVGVLTVQCFDFTDSGCCAAYAVGTLSRTI